MPTFRVDDAFGPTFDAMVGELVDWRLARYLFTKGHVGRDAVRLRVGQSDGRPLVWLDRDRHPSIHTGETRFTGDGEEFVGRFMKIALNAARRPGTRENALQGLLRHWFGASAGQPGTDHYVELRQSPGGWALRPADDGDAGGASAGAG